MTTGPQSQCFACVHLRGGDLDAPETCDAFPAGIPDEVYGNLLDHRLSIPGDGGIRFEAEAGDEFPAYAFA